MIIYNVKNIESCVMIFTVYVCNINVVMLCALPKLHALWIKQDLQTTINLFLATCKEHEFNLTKCIQSRF